MKVIRIFVNEDDLENFDLKCLKDNAEGALTTIWRLIEKEGLTIQNMNG